jgi:hypothetical protein
MREREGDEPRYHLLYLATEVFSRRPLRWFLAALFKLYFWGYRTLFRERFDARLARADAGATTYLEWVELNQPDVFETATGLKPRSAAEIRAETSRDAYYKSGAAHEPRDIAELPKDRRLAPPRPSEDISDRLSRGGGRWGVV